MKIAVIGAAGNVGQRLVKEATDRGHNVTAIGPNQSKLDGLETAATACASMQDTEAMATALKDHDVVISTVRFVHYEPSELVDAVRASGVSRLAVVGGAGSLTSPSGGLVIDGPNFPDAAKPEARAGGKVLDALLGETEIDWTYLSPSAVFTAGERTGKFRLGQETLLIDEDGKSHVSFEDFAVAMLDEIETPRHSRQRFTVGY